jgi:hypothetical protein
MKSTLAGIVSFSILASTHAASLARGASIVPAAKQGAPAASPTAPTDDASLSKDLDYMVGQSQRWKKQDIARVTFLGWTSNNHAAFRNFTCEGKRGGARGPYCEIQICVAEPTVVGAKPAVSCSGHEIEITPDDNVAKPNKDAIAKMRSTFLEATRAEIAKVGVAGKGTATRTSGVSMNVKKFEATLQTVNTGKPVVVIAASKDEQERAYGPTKATVTAVFESPDRDCLAVIGTTTFLSYFEKETIKAPSTFGAVVCRDMTMKAAKPSP